MVSFALVLYCALSVSILNAVYGEKLNVLLVIVDDLRPETESYGSVNVKTPNFNRLAENSVQFENAYTTQGICGPSRASILTSLFPTSMESTPTAEGYFENESPEQEKKLFDRHLNLPQYFQSHGYKTSGSSKFTHWVQNNENLLMEYDRQPSLASSNKCGDNVVCASTTEEDLTDFKALSWAKKKLTELSTSEDPWFCVVGFRRPHTKWNSPDYILDQVKLESVSLPDFPNFPQDIPWQAHRPMCGVLLKSDEVKSSKFLGGQTSLEETATAKLRRGYFASVMWIDKLLGDLLDHFDKLNIKESTLLVVTSDHGWLLGEGSAWCKGSLSDNSLHTPLWVMDPYSSRKVNTRETQVVSGIDLFPTIAELAMIPLNKSIFVDYGLEGRSFANLLRPEASVPASLRSYFEDHMFPGGHQWSYPVSSAFSVWPICSSSSDLDQKHRSDSCKKCYNRAGVETHCSECPAHHCDVVPHPPKYMGFSVRVEGYRYNEWRTWLGSGQGADWDEVPASQLYSLKSASVGFYDEVENLVNKRKFRKVVRSLSNMIRARFVKCECKSSKSCESECSKLGNHCRYIGGTCRNRSDCDFSYFQDLKFRKTRCLIATPCRWIAQENKCVNKSPYGRAITYQAAPDTPDKEVPVTDGSGATDREKVPGTEHGEESSGESEDDRDDSEEDSTDVEEDGEDGSEEDSSVVEEDNGDESSDVDENGHDVNEEDTAQVDEVSGEEDSSSDDEDGENNNEEDSSDVNEDSEENNEEDSSSVDEDSENSNEETSSDADGDGESNDGEDSSNVDKEIEAKDCEPIIEAPECNDLPGCKFFWGHGCKKSTYCDFTTKYGRKVGAGCLTNRAFCQWSGKDLRCYPKTN